MGRKDNRTINTANTTGGSAGRTSTEGQAEGQAEGQSNLTNKSGQSTGKINLGQNLERLETEVPTPDIVEVEIPTNEKRGRGRPPGPGKKNSQAKTDNQPIMLNENDLTQVIQGVFGLMSVPLGGHWNITKQEAENVAKPLNRILHRLDWSKSAGKYSDGVLLTLASISIVMPRVIITMQQRKVKVPQERRTPPNEHEQKGKSNEVSGNDPKPDQQSNGGYGNSLLDQLSPVM